MLSAQSTSALPTITHFIRFTGAEPKESEVAMDISSCTHTAIRRELAIKDAPHIVTVLRILRLNEIRAIQL